jgi:hypothetical protein
VVLEFSGEMIEWRGPAPFYFVRVPAAESAQIREVASMVTYGWGVIPAEISTGATTWSTSLIPKDGSFLVPVKNVARLDAGLELGQLVELTVEIDI